MLKVIIGRAPYRSDQLGATPSSRSDLPIRATLLERQGRVARVLITRRQRIRSDLSQRHSEFGRCSGKGKDSKEARKETQVLWRHAHSDISIVTCSSCYSHKFGRCSGKGKDSKEARKETQVLWRHAHSDISIVTCSSCYSHKFGRCSGKGKDSKEARKETQVLWRHAHSDISIVTCSSRYSHKVLESTMDELEDHWWDFECNWSPKEMLKVIIGRAPYRATSWERHRQVALISYQSDLTRATGRVAAY
ncbi:hypothetical protein Bca52824_082582 [Brassica carinata]|uniref:Uncharacterized protein n=1 Tax=Brassica carinata TaxID=52824 RepID=A0A8X7PIE3_BRACI|nr:hypothetical protein Bca52824_082582 [Brassica carinata]